MNKAARPKVLMVGPWSSTRGGVTTFMRNVASSRLKLKYDFIPFTTARPAKPNARGDNYGYAAMLRGGFRRVIEGALVTLWHVVKYPWIIARRRPSVIQIQASDFQAFWEASCYVVMGKIFRRPIVLRIGGSFNRFWESSGPRARAAIHWTLCQPSLLVVQSEYWKNYIAGIGSTAPVVVLNNFVLEALAEKRVLAVSRAPRFLLYCGEVQKLKGTYVLLEAMRGLLLRNANAEITLMAVTATLREELQSTGLDGRLRILDVLSHEHTLAELRRTDVFLQISTSEGFPNMLLEAMALGCAVIVTPVGAVPEVVGVDGQCAFVIPAGDAAALADRMLRLMADRELLARMGAAAHARVVERFTERSVIEVLDRAYQFTMQEQS